jgi:membrane-bound inhibitor of C-type lysozyme
MVARAFRAAAIFIVLSFLLACSWSLAQGTVGQSAQPKSHRMPVPRKFSYVCDGGLTVNVTIREQSARVSVKDESYSMRQVRSGSGARYVEGNIVWWNKGYEGFLEDETDPHHPIELAKNCKQTSPPPKFL